MPQAIWVDYSKAMAELARMLACEIAYDPLYLTELVEVEGTPLGNFVIDVPLPECDSCGGPVVQVACPECQLAARDDCPLCEGYGRFWVCEACEADG
ncbi:MAG: hypothetical protein R3D55_11965 [Chloroflexota bacterium]